MTTSHEQRRTLRVEEAAAILGIGRNAAYEAAKRGELPVLRLGRRIVVPAAALDRLLNGTGRSPLDHPSEQPSDNGA